MTIGEVELEGFNYTLDISDYKDYFPPKIEIAAFDNSTQETTSTMFGTFRVDVALNINGSKNTWTGFYTNYPTTEIFRIQGTDGILFFKVVTIKE
jgi:hypothetical protein